MRIISLLPSATEILAVLGLADRLVGVSHECDWPEDLPRLPRLTETKLDPGAPSGEIDRSVRSLVETALGVYRIDAEQLKSLQPDVIITQDQCAVCAVSMEDLERALADWLGERPQVISLSPRTLDDILDDIQRVAALTGVPERGIEAALERKRRLEEVERRAAAAQSRPRIAFLEWIEPLMAAGHWMPELARIAGGEAVMGTPGKPAPQIRFDELAAADPDVLVLTPCGFDLERTAAEAQALDRHTGFRRLRAVTAGSVFATDGSHFFNRPGPRIVDSAEILAEMVHPELFAPAHEGTAWRRLDFG